MSFSNYKVAPAGAHPPCGMLDEARRPPSPIYIELVSMTARGILDFHKIGGAEVAALALRQAQHVLLVAGFNVEPGTPETDGPVGAVALARALLRLGKRATLVTDTAGRQVARAVLDVVDCGNSVELLAFDSPHDGTDPANAANELLDALKPDAVVAVEVPARTIDGTRRNMRGENIDRFNAHLDVFTLQANRRGTPTFGVGDGGNEVGMADFFGRIPRASNGAVMASSVRVAYPITAWNSNLGAESVAALMLCADGRLDELHSPEEQSRMILAAMQAGAVDGVTRSGIPGVEVDASGKIHVSGVDGFSLQDHRAQLVRLKLAVRTHFDRQALGGAE